VLTIDVILPVTNQAAVLESQVQQLTAYASEAHYEMNVFLVDQGSTDNTPKIAERFLKQYSQVYYVKDTGVGRGSALKAAYKLTTAQVVVFMNTHLSLNLNRLEGLVAPLVDRDADVIVGSGSSVKSLLPSYDLVLKFVMGSGVSNIQHGFKAFSSAALKRLNVAALPDGDFVDTALVLKAEAAGLRVEEVNMVEVRRTRSPKGVVSGLAGLYWELKPHSQFHKLFSFGVIGVLGTVAYYLMNLALHASLGPQLANLVTLTVLTVLNIAANRKFTYRKSGRERAGKHYLAGFEAFLIALLITSGGLWVVQRFYPDMPSHTSSVIVTVLSLVATVAKYLIFSYGFRDKGKKEAGLETI
jgi:putative flippase GtrA